MRQRVVSVVAEGASLFELAVPGGVWSDDRTRAAGIDVELIQCGIDGPSAVLDSGLRLDGLAPLADHLDADLIVVPTWPVTRRPVPPELSALLRQAANRGACLVGLCLGAFAVAATGLLDGRAAVTHWRFREEFERAHPAVRFEPDTLYVDEGPLVTSAGSAAAIDCCVHLIRRDHGAEAAACIARSLVTGPHRSGTQSQFAGTAPLAPAQDPLAAALQAATEQIDQVRSVDDLAAVANTGRRSLERHLRARLGLTPKAWLDDQRVIAACRLLEASDLPVDAVAARVGYGSAASLRRAMHERRNTTPTAYRQTFRP